MQCNGTCGEPQAVEEIEIVSNEKIFEQMDEMRKALEDVQNQLSAERKAREEMQMSQSTSARENSREAAKQPTPTFAVAISPSPARSNEAPPSSLTKEDRLLADTFKEKMIDGVVVTYLKERSGARMVAVCCLDVDCSYLVVLTGKTEFNIREILCCVANLTGVFQLTIQDKDIFPAAVVDMLDDEDEIDRTLMITYVDTNGKKIRFCMVMETAEARHSFKVTLDVLQESINFPDAVVAKDVVSEKGSDMLL